MHKRFLSLWFPFFATDRIVKHHPHLQDIPFVLSGPERGRTMIKAANKIANREGVFVGMVLADAQAILPQLHVLPEEPDATENVLNSLAQWCLRFTPIVAIEPPDGLLLDISGCPHLWGGEHPYLDDLMDRLHKGGYEVRAAIADTIGCAWAIARHGQHRIVVPTGAQEEALITLPPTALRLEPAVVERLHKLGFHTIGQFIHIAPGTLRRRFGSTFTARLGQALGTVFETLQPIQPLKSYQEHLPCLEPICTATGIKIALQRLLELLCNTLAKEGKGMRRGIFKGYRIDGNVQQISIGTSRASHSPTHLFRLFELQIPTIEPALGIELFVLEALLVEDINEAQETLWESRGDSTEIAELMDNIVAKIGINTIHRYLPAAHHWPERAIRDRISSDMHLQTTWPTQNLRPLHLLPHPEPIEVMVPLPDYPPILFRHRKKIYKLVKVDGPERIEQEWWITNGKPRDYYRVEDESGARYWLFRSGHYSDDSAPEWFIHGFFA
ncbi:DNA polymerase Y family protein [Sphingobacterium sp. SGG-5]|uniref:Y-family DNA polymerase n=1 Tax=Sphingobacterium sp. SGG-5 TaxID=2710881 RepID=UPI0013EC053D|nr:DNA polymerase Y family protein [Sphingobacterium sp. SGG-5]NGM61744.1 DNA polymerase Y family protein [Sphingobacterium sp. SGG-5]